MVFLFLLLLVYRCAYMCTPAPCHHIHTSKDQEMGYFMTTILRNDKKSIVFLRTLITNVDSWEFRKCKHPTWIWFISCYVFCFVCLMLATFRDSMVQWHTYWLGIRERVFLLAFWHHRATGCRQSLNSFSLFHDLSKEANVTCPAYLSKLL